MASLKLQCDNKIRNNNVKGKKSINDNRGKTQENEEKTTIKKWEAAAAVYDKFNKEWAAKKG